jgi:tetrahydromethanopterin S-methyltransferase subunit B
MMANVIVGFTIGMIVGALVMLVILSCLIVGARADDKES